MKSFWAMGLMSGTSLDGLDGVLVRARPRRDGYELLNLHHRHDPFPKMYSEWARTVSARNLLRESARFGAAWSEIASRTCHALAKGAGVPLTRVNVIGAHGQTVVHEPKPITFMGERVSISIQLADLSRLAVRTRATVVGNFRTADLAAGGQGAPLAPHAHALLFGRNGTNIAIHNLGGIGNVTLLQGTNVHLAFDTGPGNIWIDTVVRWKTKNRILFDADGRLAARGKPNLKIVSQLLRHPYFAKRPPKSAGWEEFGSEHFECFRSALSRLSLPDSVATVTHATLKAMVQSYERHIFPKFRPSTLVMVGGGTKNRFLLKSITSAFPRMKVVTSEAYGVGVDQVEAVAFALLALETLRGRPSTSRRATGAKTPVICGQIALGRHVPGLALR